MLKFWLLVVAVVIDAVAAQIPVVPCSNDMCIGLSTGNHEYYDPTRPNEAANEAYFLSCVHGFAYCKFCWPLTLEYSAKCDQCLYKKTDECYPRSGREGTWGQWESYSDCSVNCGQGVRTRKRECIKGSNDAICNGESKGFQQCQKKFCPGILGQINAYNIAIEALQKFCDSEYAENKKTGKFQRAIFQVQKALALMKNLGDPELIGKTLNERYMKMKEVFARAVNGDHFSFARETLGKLLYVFIEMQIKEEKTPKEICSAVTDMLKELKNSTGSKFDLIFTSADESTLTFTIDTSGSMAGEIQAARSMVAAIVDVVKGQDVDCIVSPFNDPTTGPITRRPASQLHECVTDITQLRAHGGRDCPELAYTGMINALKSGPKYGSPMFVFTDASAKDATPDNTATLKTLALSQGITVNFLLTAGTPCLMDDSTYADIAAATSGQVFPLTERELPNLVAYVKSSLFIDTSIGIIGRSEPEKRTFEVDSGVFILIVSVKVTKNAASVELVSPDERPYDSNVTTLSSIKIFEVVNPLTGEWSIIFPNDVGNITFGVEAISKQPIEFTFNMQAEINEQSYAVFNPIAGQENDMIMRIAGTEIINIPTLKADIINEFNEIQSASLSLERTDSDYVYTAKFVPPPLPFRVALSGQKRDGTRFQRVSRELVTVQTSFLQVARAGDEWSAKIGENDVDVKMQVLNTAQSENYNFVIKATAGAVTPQSTTETIDGIGFIDFKYNAPTDTFYIGRLITISITAESVTTPTVHYSFEMLITE